MQQAIATNTNGSAAEPFEPNVQISFKSVKPLNIEIDIDALTVADLEFVERLSADDVSTMELVEFLGRVMPDTDIKTVPLRALPMISDAVVNAIGGAADPND